MLCRSFCARRRRFDLIRDSGGAGEFRGGLGVAREYESLQDTRFTFRFSRHVIPPSGVQGGRPGRVGTLVMNPGTEREDRRPIRYSDYSLPLGDVFRVESPGGGGLGDPKKRDPEKVLWDVLNGYISEDQALELYGVVFRRDGNTLTVDLDSTAGLRESQTS